MSALPINRHQPGTSTRETIAETKDRKDPNGRLVPVAVAAAALGMTQAHLRRKCASSPELKPYARMIGNKWHIDRGYDPRLAGVDDSLVSAEARAGERLNKMPATRRDKAVTRALILQAFRRWRKADGVEVTRDYETYFRKTVRAEYATEVSLPTLYRWDERAKHATGLNAIAAELADSKPGPRDTHCSPEAWERFCEYYLDPRKWSVGKCHRAVAHEAEQEGWGWPSLRTIQLKCKEEIPAGVKSLYREGAKAWDRDHKAPMAQDPEAYAAGECWEGDHSMLDFFARVQRRGVWKPVRLWLTAWMDRRTRCLVGHHVSESPNSETIKLALLDALKGDWSVPRYAWIDNGKDYQSAALFGLTKKEKRDLTSAGNYWMNSARGHGLLGRIGIEPHFANPYNHNGKARIERMFGTMHQDHDKEQASWCGSSKEEVDPAALKKATANVMDLPTIEQVRESIRKWFEWYNHTEHHHVADLCDADGVALSRIQFYCRRLEAERPLADPNVLELLRCTWSRRMTVSKHGIRLKIGSGTVGYGDVTPELEPFKGTDREVFVAYDPDDISEVSVFDAGYAFVCRAPMNDRYGGVGKVSAEAMRAGFLKRKQQRRAARDWKPEERVARSPIDGALDAQRQADIDRTRAKLAEDAGVPELDTPPLRPVMTPLDGQHDEIDKAERRLAAGAEDLDIDAADEACTARIIDRLGDHTDTEYPDTDDAPASFSIFDAIGQPEDEDDDAGDDEGRVGNIYDAIDAWDATDDDEPGPAGRRVISVLGDSLRGDGVREDGVREDSAREDERKGGDEDAATIGTNRRDPHAPHTHPTATDGTEDPTRTEATHPEKEPAHATD